MYRVTGYVILLLFMSFGAALAQERTILVAPSNDPRHAIAALAPTLLVDPVGEETSTERAPLMTLRRALEEAGPGTTIRLLDGVYDQSNVEDRLSINASGEPGRPLVISGSAEVSPLRAGALIDGSNLLAFDKDSLVDDPFDKNFTDFILPPFESSASCIVIDGKNHIVIEKLTFKRCRDASVRVRDSHHITLRDATIHGGQYAFLAEGRGSHHFLIENVTWLQDSSGAMWHTDHWCEFKYGRKRGLNGALFASIDIPGGVIIRRNKVWYAFNVVRTDVSKDAEGNQSLRGKLNANVEIYENEFRFIRDNVVEPEFEAHNWWIRDNIIQNAHAWFSFDGLHGGRYYIHHNIGYFDSRPSMQCDARCRSWKQRRPQLCGDLHDGGRVLKFRKMKHTPPGQGLPGPIYVFNNSWYLRSSVAKEGVIKRLSHWNNAIEYCRVTDLANGACSKRDEGKPYFNDFLPWRPGYDFRFDISNHPDFPVGLRSQGYMVDGVSVPWPSKIFYDPSGGEFQFRNSGIAARKGCAVSIDGGGMASCDPLAPMRPALGAIQGSGRGASPYVHFDTGEYEEDPRVVSLNWPPRRLPDGREEVSVVFSVPIRSSGPGMWIDLADRRSITSNSCSIELNTLTCHFAAATVSDRRSPLKLQVGTGIESIGGRPATLWGKYRDYVAFR